MFESSWFWWTVFGIASFLILFSGKILSFWREKDWTRMSQGVEVKKGEKSVKVEVKKGPKGHRRLNAFYMLIFFILSLFLAFSGVHPHQDVIPVPSSGMIYIPLYGLVFALSWLCFCSLLWAELDEPGHSAFSFFVPFALLIFGLIIGASDGLLAPIHVDPKVVFSPFLNDFAVRLWPAAIDTVVLFCMLCWTVAGRDETKIMTIITLLFLWGTWW